MPTASQGRARPGRGDEDLRRIGRTVVADIGRARLLCRGARGRSDDMKPCNHLKTTHDEPARSAGCEECLAIGDDWVHLRRCLECGHVGCCDSSKNKHATKHFRATAHPVVESFEPGESWRWCYVDEIIADSPRARAHG
jgi:hypothetical protein